jgi:hypothetical protein
MTFDQQAIITIENLEREFGTNFLKQDSIISPYSIGIEIEVKFKYLFPEIHEKWFSKNKYEEYDDDFRRILNTEIKYAEANILPKLQKTIECGIPRGLDRYWEFAFNPVNDLSLTIQQIEILKELNLIPNGEHSLHITIAGLKPNNNVYWLLSYLELLFIDKSRIEKGFSKTYTKSSDTWAKKGYGGICEKNHHDLIGCNVGFEMRTLTINENTDLVKLFSILAKYLNMIHKKENIDIFDKLISEYESRGLPNKNWQKPHMEPEIWNNFINNFDDLKEFVLKIN